MNRGINTIPSASRVASLGGINDAVTSSVHGKLGRDSDLNGAPIFPSLSYASEATGTADIDISEADYTSYQTLLTIEPPATTGQPLLIACAVTFWLNKATTGFEDVATAADTIDFIVQRKIDATNWRSDTAAIQRTAGSLGDLESVRIDIGPITSGEDARVAVKLSAERDDVELPYRVVYVGATPTVTPVAAA